MTKLKVSTLKSYFTLCETTGKPLFKCKTLFFTGHAVRYAMQVRAVNYPEMYLVQWYLQILRDRLSIVILGEYIQQVPRQLGLICIIGLYTV